MLISFRKFAGVAICFCMFTGCGLIFHVKKVSLLPATKGVSVSVAEVTAEDTALFKHAGTDTCFARLNNFKSQYVIKQQKQGYKSNLYPVDRSKFNYIRFLDLMLPLVCDVLFVGAAVTESEGMIAPALIGGTIGWVSVVGPWRTYPKKIKLPELIRLPDKNSSDRFLYVKNVKVNVNRKDFKYIYFEDLKKYQKNNFLYSNYAKEDFIFESEALADTLKVILGRINYVDSTDKIFKDPLKYTNLVCQISKISVISAGNFVSSKVQMHLSLNDPVMNKMMAEKDLEAVSGWSIHKNGDKEMEFKIIADALENATMQFINYPDFRKNFENPATSFLTEYDKWDTIHYGFEKADTVDNINSATRSVVTIKLKKGHGSGCVISNDSYIITNYHVVSDTTSKIEVILEDGSKYPAKIIRVNPLYDLALIKTQPLKLKSFDINAVGSFGIGNEVYSIGTPNDIELGQTVAKGIISGKRSFGKQTLIQTDVSINKGNSGGALVNKSGQLVGVVVSKLIGVGVEGIGFAIPSYFIREALKINKK